MISHRERIEECLSKGNLDRVPIALWRHFPVDDQTPGGLASATLSFQRNFDFDIVKVTPSSTFCLKEWGVEDEWRGAAEGTREYTKRVINHPDDWSRLPILNPDEGFLDQQISCLRLLFNELGPATPMIQTIFNPLSQAKNLVGKENLLVHMRRYPDALHAGLKTITESTRRFIEEIKLTGIAGIFFAVQHAQHGLLAEEEYSTFGVNYDLQILESAQEMWLNMLHIHGIEIMFNTFIDYPVAVINWHDRETYPDLNQAQELYSGVICGGIRRETTLVLSTPEGVTAEAEQAIAATSGKRFILGTGCVVPITAPYGNIIAARSSVERSRF